MGRDSPGGRRVGAALRETQNTEVNRRNLFARGDVLKTENPED